MREIATSLCASKCPELLEAFREEILDADDFRGDLSVSVRPDRIREIIRFAKETPSLGFDFLMDLFGMDYLDYDPRPFERFAVVYNLYSYARGARMRVKAFLPADRPELDSIHDIYRAANWFEREAWDMYGIRFRGHPNLTRILCHHEFKGHALRKDFPSDNYQRLSAPLPSTEL